MPLAEDSVRDPRVKRTRRLLRDALRKLLEEKPLDDILVQDITDAATVNRATFYDHYSDKLDLFNALIADDFEKLLEQRNVCFDGDCASGMRAMVLAVGDYLERHHRDRAECTGQAGAGPLVDAAITLAIRRIVLDGLWRRGLPGPIPHEVVASLVSGAIYGAVKESLVRMSWRADEATLTSLSSLMVSLLERSSAAKESD